LKKVLILLLTTSKNNIYMENRIQELTEKIYAEGVEKGNAEAARIVEEAKAKAAEIVKKAEAEADALVAAAQKKAAELDEHARAEIKLYGTQAVGALKSEAADIITDNVARQAVKEALAGDTLKALLVKIAERWSAEEQIVISASEADELKAYFAKNAKALLDKGVTIEQVNGKKAQFSIAPADGSYKVNFGEGEFEAFFKAFLRPQMVELLFGK
jgi:V/A-type H+-transporting ATPase subunit E